MNRTSVVTTSTPHFTAGIVLWLACILSLTLSCRFTTSSQAGGDCTDLLPADNDISGFLRQGSSAVMTDEKTIFDAIDGAAEKYIEFGFIEGVEQLYSNGSMTVDVRIFNQSTDDNASALLQQFYPSSPEILSTKSPEVVVEHALTTGYTFYYCHTNLYMELVTNEKSSFAYNMARQFYQNIHRKISANQ
ncbi:MAG: hypothetical protein JW795_10815 [Chitinivibrionales bacterium]|nr:hypothetical protein [Chitinivibrionales bacterium]